MPDTSHRTAVVAARPTDGHELLRLLSLFGWSVSIERTTRFLGGGAAAVGKRPGHEPIRKSGKRAADVASLVVEEALAA